MKNLTLILLIVLLGACQQKNAPKRNSINPVIGNTSYVEKFGKEPTAQINEDVRIKTHLSYVEKLLRKKSTLHLSIIERKKRALILDYLQSYHEAGIFPRNYDHEDERRPCFIDKDNNICAVGYLVEKTAGLEAAQAINSEFKYATIGEMNSELLENWVKTTGLSKQEIAMIQPTYGHRKKNYVGYEYASTSFILQSANVGFSSASFWTTKQKTKRRWARMGIVSGALTLGYVGYFNAFSDEFRSSNAQKQLNRINLLMGVSAIGINTLQLLQNKKPHKEKAIGWNLNVQPGLFDKPIIGLTINKKL